MMNSNDNSFAGVQNPLNYASSKKLLFEFFVNMILIHLSALFYAIHFLYQLDTYVIFIPLIVMDLYEFALVLARMYKKLKNKNY